MRRMMLMRAFTGLIATAVIGLSIGTPAHADPRQGKLALQLQIGCDNQQAYAAVSNGRGRLASLHDVTSTTVLDPVAASKAQVTVLDQDLNVLDQWTKPRASKPGLVRHYKKSLLTCNIVGFEPRPDGTTLTVLETMLVHIGRHH